MLAGEPGSQQAGGGFQFDRLLRDISQFEMGDLPRQGNIGDPVKELPVLSLGGPRRQKRRKMVDVILFVPNDS